MNDALSGLIRKAIVDRLERGDRIVAAWIGTLVEKQIRPQYRGKATPKEATVRDARRIAIHEGVRLRVGQIIRGLNEGKDSDEEGMLLGLPGFTKLQRIYIVRTAVQEKGKPVRVEEHIVRAVDMDLNDWLSKLAELESQKRGIDEHIEEIKRLIKDRWPDHKFAA
jgi:hypothetical protein